MSIKYMVRAWDFTCQTHTEKLVLIALCDNANDEGECWPSHQTIARKCNMGRRGVIYNIQRLAKAGVIEIDNRDFTSNVYHIFPWKEGGGAPDALVNGVHRGSAPDAQGVVHGVHTNRQENRKGTVSTYLATALRIYDLYPRKVGKPKAIDAIQRAIKRGEDPNALIDLTKTFAEAVSKWPKEERRFIPHPTTWFNQDRFADDPKEWERYSPDPVSKKWTPPTPEDRALDDAMEKMRRIW